MRFLYDPASSPFQQASRWFTVPRNGANEEDLKTKINTPPVAKGDDVTVQENTASSGGAPTSIDVIAGVPISTGEDTDVDSNTLTLSLVSGPTVDGSVVILNGNKIDYTPKPFYNGQDSFVYMLNDGNGGTDIATVTITVEAVNNAPVADDEGITVNEDGSVEILSSFLLDGDTDNDPGDTLTVRGPVPLSGESTVTTSNGTLTPHFAVGSTEIIESFTYEPNEDFDASDTFDYTVSDDDLTDTGTVTIDVTPVNDPPVPEDKAVMATEDTSSVVISGVGLLLNASDVDTNESTLIVVRVDAKSAKGFDVIRDSERGEVTYSPTGHFNTELDGTDSFKFTVSDKTGTATAEGIGTVTMTVDPVEDDPVAVNDGFNPAIGATQEDPTPTAIDVAENTSETEANSSVTVVVLDNDSDPDVADTSTLTVSVSTGPTNGTVEVVDGKTIKYTPTAFYNGPDSFVYTLTDGTTLPDTRTLRSDTATVFVNVTAVNNPPTVMVDPLEIIIDEDKKLSISLPGEATTLDVPFSREIGSNIEDPDLKNATLDTLTLTSVTVNPEDGKVKETSLNSGVFVYTPAQDKNTPGLTPTPVTLTYTVNDLVGETPATGELKVTITPVDDASVADPDGPFDVQEDATQALIPSLDNGIQGSVLRMIETRMGRL